MVLLINTLNLREGGGIQVALSFIQECIQFNENKYHVFVSPTISAQINQKEYPDNFYFYHFKNSFNSVLEGYLFIKQLKKMETRIRPNCVFTVFGPSYWTPKSPHLVGFARGKYLFTDSIFYKRIKPYSKTRIFLANKFHRFFFRRNSDFFYVESEDAKQRLVSFLNVSKESIFVFSNAYHDIFNRPLNGKFVLPPKNKNEFRLVTISSYYSHKNLEVIKALIPILEKVETKLFKFILTIEQGIFEKKFKGYYKHITNLGPIPIEMCPRLYHESDVLFLPTLVETFTASYPEAMKMRKPILTSDLSFAHDICGEAAEFFDPIDPQDIAEKIINLSNNFERQADLIRKGEERLKCFETASSRAKKLLEVCNKISNKQILLK